MRRPIRSISEGPTRPHATDSQRWWKAGEGGVVKRGNSASSGRPSSDRTGADP